jgi:para-aminobenzoate synthetase/4-amino-4-deoxychorismate lyase
MMRKSAFPAEIYRLVDQTPATVLLEGAEPGKYDSNEEPWTQLFTAPLRVCAARSAEQLAALFAAVEDALRAGFCAAGFFNYECGAWFEPAAAARNIEEHASGQAWFGIYERGYRIDSATGEFIDEPPAEIRTKLQMLRDRLDAKRIVQTADACVHAAAEFAIGEADYAGRIATIHECIRAGDVYQLNFTAPWRLHVEGSAAKLYASLRTRQPARYGAFVHAEPDHKILSFSPELFFSIDQNRCITTRPMKGTARRGRTTREDRESAAWLQADPKNRSENVMIVDLMRNDLGRVAKFGSVRAEKLFEVERYPTLWQMTSTVTAGLRDEATSEAIFRALFPCGSVTGAPKVRAMQLIAELEDNPRGVYTGAIGFFSPRRTVFNVAIRTLELKGSIGTMGTGSGVVIDSVAADEYRECLLKAEFLTRATGVNAAHNAGDFSLIETMLWEESYPFIELHLDRLMDSAEYFSINASRDEVHKALDDYSQQFAAGSKQRVRLLLDRYGQFEIAHQALAEFDPGRVGRVRIASERTDPADPMLFHKTTARELYARAHEQAQGDEFDDLLFFNLRGELTEGAISNVFIEKDGRLLTPSIECGLLAGVYRRYLLESRNDVEERILNEDDLRNADAVYLANAVRGLRRVNVEFERSA